MGFTYQMMQFQEERLAGAAMCIKGLEQCINSTIEYTSQREAFGKPLIDNQIIHMRLAEMQMEIESLRALCLLRSFVALGDDVSFNCNAFSHDFPINTNSLLSSVFRHSREGRMTESGISFLSLAN